MVKSVSRIPQVDQPDEITRTDMPEIGDETPHPQSPNPQV
ncbi:hypothetical protein skT53_09230 [Effusibacillus dendaii]|uniref:Uncharacterized protein n=1 Tax=Effusibacillus dendaii TaxID=2743772 RepID=A0A7I8D709_9BACL|nr:hypothetical protein skT53_09230 [Effusibacillus dendaii]